MRTFGQIVLLTAFAWLSSAAQAEAQNPAPKPTPSPSPIQKEMPMNIPMPTPSPMKMPTATPKPTPSPMAMPMNMPMPLPTPTPAPRVTPDEQTTTSPNLYPSPKGWPKPVEDRRPNTFLLADVFEFRPKGNNSEFRWDIEGWHGGDYNRIWFKSEGEQSATRSERNIDFQVLYGRFVKRYYDFQVGARAETKTFRGASVTRGQFVIGIEGLVPYRYELETALFVSHQGDVSGRASFTRDYLFNQKWILQGRFETNFAVQRVERFGLGRGLNDIELGLRLRHEIRREFAPYIGVSWDRKLFGTADFTRLEGKNPSQLRFVLGVRLWR
ncbi:MAG TPA: copper resistance protein B [Pyrinomonadaceae bacterium]|nr:copper resistance protein B [Pyrinomonadaceae bacterium]